MSREKGVEARHLERIAFDEVKQTRLVLGALSSQSNYDMLAFDGVSSCSQVIEHGPHVDHELIWLSAE